MVSDQTFSGQLCHLTAQTKFDPTHPTTKFDPTHPTILLYIIKGEVLMSTQFWYAATPTRPPATPFNSLYSKLLLTVQLRGSRGHTSCHT